MKHSNPSQGNSSLNPTSDRPLFALGKVSATPGALDAITEAHGERWRVAVQKLLARHLRCEQGELTPGDHAANLEAVSNKTRIFSAFRLPTTIPGKLGVKLWIITEADRAYTTLLLPDEY
jgi:hypothetical protein